jgi:hypothetical protein
MKSGKLVVGIAALFILTAGSVLADGAGSVFGAMKTAKTLGQGRTDITAGVGLADATSFTGVLTYGLGRYTDGRLKLALVDDEGSNGVHIGLGGDFVWQFWNLDASRRYPMDMGIGAFFEYRDFGPASVFEVGTHLLASYPFQLSRGGTLSPYGRFNARLEKFSVDRAGSDSELELGLNGGIEWAPTTTMRFYGEFQFDGNDGLFLGIDFNLQ